MRKAGRPKKNESHPATRDLILKSARTIFARHGYHRASLDEVAEAVDIRVPSLLYHFPTKQALFEGVVHDLAVEVTAVLDRVYAVQGSPGEKFRQALQELIAFEKRESVLLPIVVSETFTKDPATQDVLVKAIAPMLDRVDSYFRDNVEPPIGKRAPLREVVVMLLLAYSARSVLGKNAQKIWGPHDNLLPLATTLIQSLQKWPMP